MDNEREIWLPVIDFKDISNYLYEISSHGNVRNVYTSTYIHKKIANKKHHPYYAVNLRTYNGGSKWVLVHQLVATYFVKVPDKYIGVDDELVPDHLDNNGLNNYYKNLEWKTRGENVKTAHEKGQINNSCDNNANAIVSNETVEKICECFERGMNYDDILQYMNFGDDNKYRKLLVRIKNRVAWKNISKKYNFDSYRINYTPAQMEIVERFNDIIKLINEGKTNYQIIRELWGDDIDKRKCATKSQSITKIRKREIFKELFDIGSSDMESYIS